MRAIGQIGVSGGRGHVLEYTGEAVRALSMEGRMTVCNMSIEAGARAGMVAPDDTTFAYLEGRPGAPQGADWERALDEWRALRTDEGAAYDDDDRRRRRRAEAAGHVGHEPGDGRARRRRRSRSGDYDDPEQREAVERALRYMDLAPGTPLVDVRIDKVFIGSCTNARIEDLRAAATVVAGRHVADGVQAIVVPGSARVKQQAEEEGLREVFESAGFEWRRAGCSMCLGMNPDILSPASAAHRPRTATSKGARAQAGARISLSPAMAAAAA